MPTNETFLLENVALNTTILQIKHKIDERYRISLENLILELENKTFMLNDQTTLSEAILDEGYREVHFRLRLPK